MMTESDLDLPTFKIAFLAEDALVENMFAEPLDSGQFRLDNLPFHVFGISCDDEFSVRVDDGGLAFDRVTRRGEHSTYRVKLPAGAPHEAFMREWPFFEALGCGFEGSGVDVRRLYAIDIR